jgi:hypothetical protein
MSVKRQRNRETRVPPSWPRSASTPGWTARLPIVVARCAPMELGSRSHPGIVPSHGTNRPPSGWSVPKSAGGGAGVERVSRQTPLSPPEPGIPVSGRARLCAPPAVRSLMPPAPSPSVRGVGRQPGGGAPCTPVAAHSSDSVPAAPPPAPHKHAANPTAGVPPPTPVRAADGTRLTRCLAGGHTRPRRAPARPRVAAHAAASAHCTAPGVSAASAAAPGRQGL